MDEQSIFAEALERDPAARPAYLDAACGDNPSLRRRLDVLLREYEHAGSFLERPVAARPDSADAPEALAPADGVLGDFRILREIGRGGMGVVYEAEQISLKRRVALKVLPFAAVLDKRQLQRFRTEAMAAGRLHHPHIVPVYQVGCERAVHFYAMQYVEGRNVSELLEAIRSANTTSRARQEAAHERSNADPEATQIERPRFSNPRPSGGEGGRRPGEGARHATPPSPHPAFVASLEGGPSPPRGEGETAALRDTALLHNFSTDYSTNKHKYHRTIAELGIQAAEALDYAHEHGILHRDVKPSNLMLDDEGNLWITDFGLARIEGDSGLTMSGDLLGTLRYMSPEQVLGKRVIIDERTDVYSLGVTLYEMLTLRPAYEGTDRADLLRKISFEEPLPPRKLDPTIPTDLDTIVLKAMQKVPGDRYLTIGDLLDDLHRFLRHEPIRAQRPTLVQRATKWSRRHPAVLWSAISILLMTTLALSVSFVLIWNARTDVEAARQLAVHRYSEAQTEAAKANAVVDLLSKMLESANPDKMRGRDYSVRQMLDDFSKRLDDQLRDEPEVEATLRSIVGSAYRRLGLTDAAEPHVKRALELRRRTYGDQHQMVSDSLIDYAWLQFEQGDHQGSADTARQAVAVLRRQGRPEDVVRGLRILTLNLRQRGAADRAEATQLSLEAMKLVPRTNPDLISIIHNLASVKTEQGEYEEAEQLAREALALHKAVDGPNHPETGWSLRALSTALRSQGKHQEALECARKALAVFRTQYTDGHKSIGLCLGDVLVSLSALGEFEEARTVSQEFVAACADNAGALNSCAWSMSTDRSFFDPALPVQLAEKAVELAPTKRVIWNTLGVARYRNGDWSGTLDALNKSMELCSGGDSYDWYFLAMAHWQLGHEAEAIDWFKKASKDKLEPFHAEAAALLGITVTPNEANQVRPNEAGGTPDQATETESRILPE